VTSSCLAQKNRADGNDVRVCEVTTESLLCECFRPFWVYDGQLFRNRIKEGLGKTPREPSAACAATLAEYTPRETATSR
jgi:hypothetical protein